jgi:hypothetical protein
MAEFKLTPTKLGKMIDDIERIREELLVFQNDLQEMESVAAPLPIPKRSK